MKHGCKKKKDNIIMSLILNKKKYQDCVTIELTPDFKDSPSFVVFNLQGLFFHLHSTSFLSISSMLHVCTNKTKQNKTKQNKTKQNKQHCIKIKDLFVSFVFPSSFVTLYFFLFLINYPLKLHNFQHFSMTVVYFFISHFPISHFYVFHQQKLQKI